MIPDNGYTEKSVANFHKWLSEKEHKIMDELIDINTVADLKKMIEKLPDDMGVLFYTNDNTYFIEASVGKKKCQAHNGKLYESESEGLIFEVY